MSIMTQLEFELDFSHSEKEIAHYILNEGEKVLNLSIKELAKKTYTSPATIVRLCHKLGLEGYGDFKIKYSAELQFDLAHTDRIDVNFPFNEEDNDSMVAYKNDKYLHFGRCAAKLDDIANFIPARISAFLMILAAFVCRLDWKNAWRIFKRDRYNHASPNSAQTEAVMAGALDVALAGNAYYFGKLYEKKTIGDAIRKIKPDDIILANRMLYVAATISVILFAVIRILLQLI